MKHMIHFSQTQHATDYLKQCGIEPVPLIDSINEDFLNDNHLEFANTKQDIILYNPNKGKKVTEKLIAANPQWQFVPLKGLNREQLSEQLYAAKLYIDFGHHPGRDRMPREAAMHGCCLITGVLGSAGNEIDLPILKRYKLDSSAPEFVAEFSQLARDILANFAAHYRAFDNYRDYLKNEPKVFRQQISDYFLQTQK